VSLPGLRTRVGLIVPRFRQSAVLRNRLKRRLRELSRLRLLTSDVPADVVIRIRPGAYQASFAELSEQMHRVITQLVRWDASDQLPRGAGDGAGTTMPDKVQDDT
jgi:ribonuclease P protein component